MFNMRILTIIASLLFSLFFMVSCQETTQPKDEQATEIDAYYYATVENDIKLMHAGGLPFQESSGIFSIDWNNFIGSDLMQIKAPVSGNVFVIAYDEIVDSSYFRRLLRIGKDMGSVFLGYSETEIELNKIETPRGGIFYSNFEPQVIGRHGRIGQVRNRANHSFGSQLQVIDFNGPAGNFIPVEFISDTEYTFEINGNNDSSPFTVSMTSPLQLIKITSHRFQDEIDPASDLRLTWEGASDGQVIIRISIPQILKPGEVPDPAKINDGIFETTEVNTGTYIISKEKLQGLIQNAVRPMFWVHLSALHVNEVLHEDKTYHGVMRHGDQVILRIPSAE